MVHPYEEVAYDAYKLEIRRVVVSVIEISMSTVESTRSLTLDPRPLPLGKYGNGTSTRRSMSL